MSLPGTYSGLDPVSTGMSDFLNLTGRTAVKRAIHSIGTPSRAANFWISVQVSSSTEMRVRSRAWVVHHSISPGLRTSAAPCAGRLLFKNLANSVTSALS